MNYLEIPPHWIDRIVAKGGRPFYGDALVAFIVGMSIDSDLLTYFGVALSRILENS